MSGKTTFLAGLLAAAVISCLSSEEKKMLESKPDFVGFVTVVQPDDHPQPPTHLIVESHANKEVERHFVSIPRHAICLRREAEATRPLDPAAIKAKDWVEIWFAGPKDSAGLQTVRQLIVTDRPD